MTAKILYPFLAILATGMQAEDTVSSAWKKILKPCSKSDIFSKEVIFFGPSNSLGVGSVWKMQEALSPGSTLSDIVRTPEERAGVVTAGGDYSCSGVKRKKWSLKLAIPLAIGGEPATVAGVKLDIDISATLSRAKTIRVTASRARLEMLLQTRYEAHMNGLPKTDIFWRDLATNQRFVTTKSLAVKGLSFDFEVGTAVVSTLQAKLKSGDKVSFGEKGATFTVDYSDSKTVRFNSESENHVGGVVRPVIDGKVAAGGSDPRLMILDVQKLPESTPVKLSQTK
jgi:hypothetical protein